MLFSSRFSTKTLVSLCRTFRVSLSAGLALADVFRQQASKGPLESRAVIGRIADRLRSGDNLEDVLKEEKRYFPPLFVGMAAVGEQTGNLAEVFRELEEYYRTQLSLRRQFLSEITWPVIQFVMAIVVLSLLIFILGMLPTPWDPIGIGVGPVGVFRFLGGLTVLFVGGWLSYILITRGLGKTAAVHGLLLRTPVIGPCYQAVCLARFCLGLHLTLDTSLSTSKAIRLSLQATGNGAYESCGDGIAAAVKSGGEIAPALDQARVFPEELVHVVATGEESGQLPEVMGHQAEAYTEEASLKMKVLTRMASFAVWGFVALLMLLAIIRILLSIAGVYEDAMKGI